MKASCSVVAANCSAESSEHRPTLLIDLGTRWDKDTLLTVVTLYWAAGTIGSSFRRYYIYPLNEPVPQSARGGHSEPRARLCDLPEEPGGPRAMTLP